MTISIPAIVDANPWLRSPAEQAERIKRAREAICTLGQQEGMAQEEINQTLEAFDQALLKGHP